MKSIIMWGGAYQFSKNLALGGQCRKTDDNYVFEVGGTTNLDKLGAEIRYLKYKTGNHSSYNQFDANLLYSFDPKIRAGFEAIKTQHVDDPDVIAKVKYTVNDQKSYVLMHRMANHDQNSSITYFFVDFKLK